MGKYSKLKKTIDFCIPILHDTRHLQRAVGIGAEFEKQGYTVLFLTNTKKNELLLKNKNKNFENYYKKISTKKINENNIWKIFKKKYKISVTFNKFIYVTQKQRPYFWLKNSKCLKIEVAKKILGITNIYAKYSIKYTLSILASEIDRLIISAVAAKDGLYHLQYTQSPIPNNEILFVDDGGRPDIVFRHLFKNAKEADPSIRKKILKLVRVGINKKAYLGRSIPNFYYIKSKIRNIKISPLDFWRIAQKVTLFIKTKIYAMVWRAFSNKTFGEKSFYFFPLHAPNEDTVLLRGFPFENEVELIKNISLIIPENKIIVVKEHPGWEGWRSLSELRQLLNLPNVRLINSKIPGIACVKFSNGVFTINSSAWFEAILFSKKCYCFGTGLYTPFNVVNTSTNFKKIAKKINDKEITKEEHKNRIILLSVLKKLSYPGTYNIQAGSTSGTINIAEAALKHIKKLKI